jgi:hypothetical protein
MLTTLQRELQQTYKWLKELRPHPDDAAWFAQWSPATESATETATTETQAETETTDAARLLRLDVIVSSYRPKEHPALLASLGIWARTHSLDLAPCILTEAEDKQLDAFGQRDSLTPATLMTHYKTQDGYPGNARKQINRALDEFERMLRGLEQEFPTSGLQAWNVGLRLEAIASQILAWGLALQGLPHNDGMDDWETMVQGLHGYTNKPINAAFVYFPMHLQSFLQHHRHLVSLVPSNYGDNELELVQLIMPLEQTVKALRRLAGDTLTSPAEQERRQLWLLLAVNGTSALVIIALVIVYFQTRRDFTAGVKLPKGALTGGVVGSYFKGRDLKQFRRKRVDRGLNFKWKYRPAPGLPSDHFSIRWKGYIQAPTPGPYQICLRYDDAARFKVNNIKITDDWVGGPARSRCKKFTLSQGWHPFKIEFFEFNGPAELRLRWRTPKRTKLHPIPARRLCCRR